MTAERLLQAVRREPVLWNGQLIRCTISIGYASFPMAGSATDISLESAISLVDKALYEAKRRGRDRACLIKVVSARDEKELTQHQLRIRVRDHGSARLAGRNFGRRRLKSTAASGPHNGRIGC